MNRPYMFLGALALALAALLQSRAETTFDLVDLSSCRKAGAFADAVFLFAEVQIWRIANPRPKKRHYGGANLENCKFAPFTVDGWMRNIYY